MSERFLNYLDKIGRKRIIMDRDGKSPYLARYYLFLKDRIKFPFNIFLHNFLRSDPDDQHDHPWLIWMTIILKGGYWEWLLKYDEDRNIIGEYKIWRSPGTILFKKATTFHRIEIVPGIDCWTLFIPGPQIREWGFLTHKNWKLNTFKWVKHDKYITDKNAKKG